MLIKDPKRIEEVFEGMNSSASGRETAARCGCKFFYQCQSKFLKIPRKNLGIGAANTGSIIHAILEGRYLGFEDPSEYAFAIPPHDEYPEMSKDQHNRDFIIATYIAYNARWPLKKEPQIFKISPPNLDSDQPPGEFDNIPALEYEWLDDDPVEKSILRDRGFIDRIIILPPPPENVLNEDGIYIPEEKQRPVYSRNPGEWEIWPTDTKTTSQDIDDRKWYLRHTNKVQFALYLRNLRLNINSLIGLNPERNYVIPGFMVDSVMHTRSKRKFKRMWMRDEYTVEKCEEIIAKSDEAMQLIVVEQEITENHDACMDYRTKCDFYDLCHGKYKTLPLEDRLPKFIEDTKLKLTFDELMLRWDKETALMSNPTKKLENENYLALIQLGEDVIPLVIDSIEQSPSFAFNILRELTGEDVTKKEDAGKIEEQCQSWIDWFNNTYKG